MWRSNVLLPQPLPPMITSVSPRLTLNEMSLITARSPNLRTRSVTSIIGESVGAGMINNDEIRMTKFEGSPKFEWRKNHHGSFELGISSLFRASSFGLRAFLFVSPDLGEDQVQLSRFRPELSRFWFEFRYRANDHSKEMFRFACLFPA